MTMLQKMSGMTEGGFLPQAGGMTERLRKWWSTEGWISARVAGAEGHVIGTKNERKPAVCFRSFLGRNQGFPAFLDMFSDLAGQSLFGKA